MDDTHVLIIISLLGFIQTISIAVISYLFKVLGTIFTKLDNSKKECRDLIDRNTQQDKTDKQDLEKKLVDLLDSHYVTTGQLSTLEQKLMGEIKGLSSAINGLTEMIRSKL